MNAHADDLRSGKVSEAPIRSILNPCPGIDRARGHREAPSPRPK